MKECHENENLHSPTMYHVAQATHINVPLISLSSYYNACFIDNKALHLKGLW